MILSLRLRNPSKNLKPVARGPHGSRTARAFNLSSRRPRRAGTIRSKQACGCDIKVRVLPGCPLKFS